MAESVLEAKFHPPGGDEDEQTSLCRAFTRFSQDLDPKERNDFAKVTILDLLLNARDWDASHASSSTSRSVANRINPFLLFVHRHAKAVDTMVQCYPNPSALIWGMMRVVLEVCKNLLDRLFLLALVVKNSIKLTKNSLLGHSLRTIEK